MAAQICTQCGYEGRGKVMGERRGGGAARVAGMVLMLPIHSLWKAMDFRSRKLCPHCGLPTMVRVTSNAGRLARHKVDVELGLVQVKKPEAARQNEAGGFGNTRSSVSTINKKPVDPEQF